MLNINTVSVTERGTFRRCRRQWHYSSFNRLAIEPIVTKPYFSLGTLVHAAIAGWLAHPEANVQQLYNELALAEIQKVVTQYRATVGVGISEAELQPFNDIVLLGSAMMKNYQQKYQTPLAPGFTIIKPEQQVVIPIPGITSEICSCEHMDLYHSSVNGPCAACECTTYNGTIYLEAQFDGLLQRQADGAIFILEHKTYNRKPSTSQLQMNDQFLAYIWAANQIPEVGKVIGLAYNGLWSRATPPHGRVFDDLFLRTLIVRPSYEQAEFEDNLRWEAKEMVNPGVAIYPNRRWEGCYDCRYENLCSAQSRGEDTEHVLRTFYKPREHYTNNSHEEEE